MKRRRGKLALLGLALIVAVFAVQYCRLAADTVTVEQGNVQRYVLSRATVVPQQGISQVRTRLDGTVLTVHVREGDTVAQGQLLAEIEADVFEAKLSRIEAEYTAMRETAIAVAKGARAKEREAIAAQVEAATFELEIARRRAEREQKLHASGSSSDAKMEEAGRDVEIKAARLDFERARLDLARSGGNPHEAKSAEAKAIAAQAAIVLAKKQLSWTRIVAPVAGVVLSRSVDPGDTIAAPVGVEAGALFEIADTSRTEVRVEVEETDVRRIQIGQKVKLMFPGGKNQYARGHIVRRGARMTQRQIGGDPANIRADSLILPVFVELDLADPIHLPIGQRLEAHIELDKGAVAKRLPRNAVAIRDGYAFVELREGLWRTKKRVELVMADGEHVEVQGIDLGTEVYLP